METPLSKKNQNKTGIYQKRYPTFKEKEEATKRQSAGGIIAIKPNPIHVGWVTHRLENNYTTEVL